MSDEGEGAGDWVKVADVVDCPSGTLFEIEAGQESLVLANVDLAASALGATTWRFTATDHERADTVILKHYGPALPGPFVEVQGHRLVLDGSPFRYAGWNFSASPSLMYMYTRKVVPGLTWL